jgi:AcrR family transcriptional regulator
MLLTLNERSTNKRKDGIILMSPRSEEQNQLIRDERYDQILEHAMRLFAKQGYAATKISDVARSAALSQGLVYHYFASKEEMFIAAVRQTIELSNNSIKMLTELPLEPDEKMRMLTERNIDYKNPGDYALRWLLMFQVGLTDSTPVKARELLRGKFAAVVYVEEIIRAGQEKGLFNSTKDAGSLAIAYWSLMQGLVFFNALNNVEWGTKVNMPDVETVMKLLQ